MWEEMIVPFWFIYSWRNKDLNLIGVVKLFKKSAFIGIRELIFFWENRRHGFVGCSLILESMETRKMSWRNYCLFVIRTVTYKYNTVLVAAYGVVE